MRANLEASHSSPRCAFLSSSLQIGKTPVFAQGLARALVAAALLVLRCDFDLLLEVRKTQITGISAHDNVSL